MWKLYPHILPEGMHNDTATLENSVAFTLTIPPSNSTILGIYPSEIKLYVHIKSCTVIFIVNFSLLLQTRNRPNVLQLVNKHIVIHPHKETRLSHKRVRPSTEVPTTWVNVKHAVLSERRQTKKATYRMMPCM